MGANRCLLWTCVCQVNKRNGRMVPLLHGLATTRVIRGYDRHTRFLGVLTPTQTTTQRVT